MASSGITIPLPRNQDLVYQTLIQHHVLPSFKPPANQIPSQNVRHPQNNPVHLLPVVVLRASPHRSKPQIPTVHSRLREPTQGRTIQRRAQSHQSLRQRSRAGSRIPEQVPSHHNAVAVGAGIPRRDPLGQQPQAASSYIGSRDQGSCANAFANHRLRCAAGYEFADSEGD